MKRSRKHILVPYCALSQGIRADTIVKHYPAIVKDVIEYLIINDINIMQMPCPELYFDGIRRKPCGKSHYDTPINRKICREVSIKVVEMLILLQSGGYEVIGILGVDYSPSCSVNYIGYNHSDKIRGTGIYIEELQKVLQEHHLQIPMIGIENYDISNTMHELKKLVSEAY